MRLTKPLRILIILLVLAISAGAVMAYIQENLPPQVLAVQPYPGEEMPLDSPLTVIFNQAMNRETVEAAWSITPTVEGAFSWEDDRTLVFTPANGWLRETSYELTIGQSAAADNELSLADPYQATLRTVGRLLVNSVIPAENTDGVAADATITIAFNRPVVPLGSTVDLASLPNPLSIEPAVSGQGEWLNTSIYQFVPGEDLLGGATYTVMVNAGLTAVSGATLDENYIWTFQTLVPEILATYPSDGSRMPLEDSISISFSQPMNQEATESAFRLLHQNGEPVAGEFSWSSDGKQLVFTPADWLTIQTIYQLVLDAETARGVGGAALRQGRDFTFSSMPLPYVEHTWPSNGENDVSPGYRRTSISFGTPMNTETFADKVVISPQPAEVTPLVYGNRELSMEFEFVSGTTYTITLLAGTEDVYGNAISVDYTYSFTVGEVQPYVYIQDARRFIVTGAYRQDTVLSASIAASPTVGFKLYSVPTDYVPQTFQYMYDETLETLIQNSELARDWSLTLETETTYANVKVNLAAEQGGALSPGVYLIVARYNPDTWIQQVFNGGRNEQVYPVVMAVANTNITLKRMENEALIWVTDMESGRPLVEQPVTIYGHAGEVYTSGYTDSEGVLRLSTSSSGFVMIVSESEGRYGVWKSDSAPNPPDDNLYIYTERPLYRPGETLYFRGVYRHRDDFNYSVSSVQNLEVVITDTQGPA